jgi:hypothetical protein
LLIWVVEAEQGHKDDANQALSAYLKDDSLPKDEWAKNIGAFLTDQMSEADLVASADSSNPFQNQLQHCRVWYFIGIKHQIAGEKAAASEAFRKCLATDQKYADYYLLARAQLPEAFSGGGTDSWLNSQLRTILDTTDQLGQVPLVVLLLGGCLLSFSIISVIVVILILSSRPKRTAAPRFINRVPPMK